MRGSTGSGNFCWNLLYSMLVIFFYHPSLCSVVAPADLEVSALHQVVWLNVTSSLVVNVVHCSNVRDHLIFQATVGPAQPLSST